MKLSHIHEDKMQADAVEIRITVKGDSKQDPSQLENPLDHIEDDFGPATGTISVEIWHDTMGKFKTYTGKIIASGYLENGIISANTIGAGIIRVIDPRTKKEVPDTSTVIAAAASEPFDMDKKILYAAWDAWINIGNRLTWNDFVAEYGWTDDMLWNLVASPQGGRRVRVDLGDSFRKAIAAVFV